MASHDLRLDGSDPRLEFVNLLGDQPQHLTSHAGQAIVLAIPDDRNQPATLCRPCAAIRPNSAKCPRSALANMMRCRTRSSRPVVAVGLREPAYPATLNV